MPVLHWWFVTVPVFLGHRIARGGLAARGGVLLAMLLYGAATLAAAVGVLAGCVAMARFTLRRFATGFRKRAG